MRVVFSAILIAGALVAAEVTVSADGHRAWLILTPRRLLMRARRSTAR